MFKFFRGILVLLSLACTLLSVWALVGSYKNESYLTKTNLINFHLTQLDLSSLFDTSYSKRQLPTRSTNVVDKRYSWYSAETDYTGDTYGEAFASTVAQFLETLSYNDLGLADVYSISFWGYCRGTAADQTTYDSELGELTFSFDNKNVNYTYCSKPKIGYKFDPYTVLKHEIANAVDGAVDGSGVLSTTATVGQLYTISNYLEQSGLQLPGDLDKKLTLLNNLTRSAGALILAAAVLSFVAVIAQVLGCFLDPDSCCLAFLTFLYQVAISIILIVGGALVTYTYMYVRKQVNNNIDEYGVKAFLSINFYAFVWSAWVASVLVVLFSLLGHCCGLFGTGRRKFRRVAAGGDSEMGYDHRSSSESDEK